MTEKSPFPIIFGTHKNVHFLIYIAHPCFHSQYSLDPIAIITHVAIFDYVYMNIRTSEKPHGIRRKVQHPVLYRGQLAAPRKPRQLGMKGVTAHPLLLTHQWDSETC